MASNEGQGGERTEKATPKRRREAREKGQVRKSQELVSALMLVIMFGALGLLGPGMWEDLQSLMRRGLTLGFRHAGGLVSENAGVLMQDMAAELAGILLPLLLIGFLGAILSNVVQFGFLFSTKALAPKFNRLNPLEGLKRIFSMQTLFQLAKAIAKTVLIAFIAYDVVVENAANFALMAGENLGASIGAIAQSVLNAGFRIGLVFLIIAVLDFVYQWFKYEKDLRMSKYEIKMEYKQTEGDPQVKSRIKQKQRQMAMMRMMESVPQADVVITNPTHFAVALKYDAEASSAPVVTAKGQDYLALRIKAVAQEHGVEIVENKPVARALYESCAIGSEIPLELYQAVAEILALIYKRKQGRA